MKPLIVCIILGQFIVLTHVSIVFAILKDNSVRVLQLGGPNRDRISRMWTPREKQTIGAPEDVCGICGMEVEQEQKAMQCDMCETWEHVACVRVPDRLDDNLYQALTKCRSKAILYCCVSCRKGGSLSKRMNKLETECALLSEQRLASTCECDVAQEALEQLRIDSDREREELLSELNKWRRTPSALIKSDRSRKIEHKSLTSSRNVEEDTSSRGGDSEE